MQRKVVTAASLILLIALPPVVCPAQVLGPCGAPSGEEEAAMAAQAAAPAPAQLLVKPVPLPGQRAMDFELTAVVGDDIKNIRLSDYQGKWRILCFFPAAFTFV
jgi:hypothetical protein